MATEIVATLQGSGEIRTHFIDFTGDLPAAVTIISAVAVHVPPTGAAVIPTVGVIAAGIVPVTVPALTVTGRHVVTVTATLSSGDKSEARLIIPVEWDAPRPTMSALIQDLRGITNTGSNDYKVGGMPYWTDYQLQEALDSYQTILDYQPMEYFSQRAGSVYEYKIYQTGYRNFEGTPTIMNGDGGTIAAGFTFGWRQGKCTFASDQAGSVRTFTGTIYDLNAAAAQVWRTKASHYAEAYDFSADNHSMKRSQLMAQARERAGYYAALSAGQSGLSLFMEREDC